MGVEEGGKNHNQEENKVNDIKTGYFYILPLKKDCIY